MPGGVACRTKVKEINKSRIGNGIRSVFCTKFNIKLESSSKLIKVLTIRLGFVDDDATLMTRISAWRFRSGWMEQSLSSTKSITWKAFAGRRGRWSYPWWTSSISPLTYAV